MASSGEVKVLGARISIFVHRVIWALKIKGVEFEYIEEDLRNKSAMLLEYNPIHKKVPVLVHAGKSISESLVILQYIDETWPEKPIMHHKSPYEKAMERFWAKYIDDKLWPNLWNVVSPVSPDGEKHVDAALESLQVVEDHLKGKKFFSGETMGFSDIAAAFLAYFIDPMEEESGIKLIKEEKFPAIHAWMKNIMEIPIVKDNIPARHEFSAYYHRRKQAALAAAAAPSNN